MKLIFNDFKDKGGFKRMGKGKFISWYGDSLRIFFDDPEVKDYLDMNNFDALAYLWVAKQSEWVLNVLFYFLVNMCNLHALIDEETFINIKQSNPIYINNYNEPDNPHYPFLFLNSGDY